MIYSPAFVVLKDRVDEEIELGENVVAVVFRFYDTTGRSSRFNVRRVLFRLGHSFGIHRALSIRQKTGYRGLIGI